MENMDLLEPMVPTKKDLSYFVNITTLIMCGFTMLGYIIYMTWTIASFVSDIDKRLSLQQQSIEQININLDKISDAVARLEDK